MNVLIYLVPVALGLGLTGLAAFLWTLRSGQYDDIDGAALRILPDDDLEGSECALADDNIPRGGLVFQATLAAGQEPACKR
jgi:cbb3-type cytochrome oxidase maturation protein